jgi:hypothetical protein
MKKQRPEALAEFAESARHPDETIAKKGKQQNADKHTSPKPEDNAKKHDAATKVLREGATGRDEGADEAVQRTQDRIKESR